VPVRALDGVWDANQSQTGDPPNDGANADGQR
jgi:hypothetical protein